MLSVNNVVDSFQEGMSTSVNDGLALSWHNLNVWTKPFPPKHKAKAKDQPFQLIKNVSGITKSGALCAIMSPSGAGKTSLLAALNLRVKGLVEGEILLNGCLISRKVMSRISGYVPQKDFIIEELTVLEHMQFMAKLTMDRKTSWIELNETVTRVMENLGINHRRTVQISELSGGQRKRLALAVQLLTEPRILFCDEPTTGLDSYSAMNVVRLLKQLASEGRIVVCAIHQPTSGVFEMFDTVTLLAHGGLLAYHGHVRNVLKHFANMGMECPPSYNSAEFLVSQLSTRSGGKNEYERLEQVRVTAESYKLSSDYETLLTELDAIKSSDAASDATFQHINTIDKVLPPTEFMWLFWRSYIKVRRTYQQYVLRFCLYVLIMLMVSTPFGAIQIDQTGIQNLQGLLYVTMAEVIFGSAYGVLFTFPEEIPVFLRDVGDRVYSPGTYYLAKLLVMLPRVMIETFFYTSIVFWIAELSGGFMASITFSLPVIASAATASAYGCFLSATFESINTASLLSVPMDFVGSTFGGLFIQLRSLPGYMSWIKYTSMFYYTFEALSIHQWKSVASIPCTKANDICLTSGEQVLQSYGLDKDNITLDFSGLIAMFAVFHILGFFALIKRSFKE
uniref:Protein scarlet n=1 Tax=Cacopsylla melanoneura TaxID=428564 RepID=A0A8D8SG41_9HEMI